MAKRLSKKKKKKKKKKISQGHTCKDIQWHRYIKPQQKYILEMVSKNLSDGLNRFYVATTLIRSSAVVYTTFVQSARGVSNSSVQHLREHKNQTNTEMKQR